MQLCQIQCNSERGQYLKQNAKICDFFFMLVTFKISLISFLNQLLSVSQSEIIEIIFKRLPSLGTFDAKFMIYLGTLYGQ